MRSYIGRWLECNPCGTKVEETEARLKELNQEPVDIEIDIDTWPGLSPYVEFEGESEEKIKEVFKILDLDYKDAITDNAQDIYMSLGYTQEDLNNLKF